jgi:hypothetical protein
MLRRNSPVTLQLNQPAIHLYEKCHAVFYAVYYPLRVSFPKTLQLDVADGRGLTTGNLPTPIYPSDCYAILRHLDHVHVDAFCPEKPVKGWAQRCKQTVLIELGLTIAEEGLSVTFETWSICKAQYE